jgi:hypothetical protein
MLVEFLHENRDIFAWQPSDMNGVPRELAEHALQIIPGSKPVRQAMRRFGDKKTSRHSKGNIQAIESRLRQRGNPYKVGGKSLTSS